MQVPDLEAVLHTHDSPLVPEAPQGAQQPAPPIFGYTTGAGFTDVPYPDFSYWGHEHRRLVGAQNLYPCLRSTLTACPEA
jgi:Glycosyl transferase family 90